MRLSPRGKAPTLLSSCTGPSGNRKEWQLIREESKFCDWQKARVQELSEEIPTGSMPRSMDVIMRADLVEQARPGDKMVFSGCLIVIPDISVIAGPEGKLTAGVKGVNRDNNSLGAGEGVSGLKALGVRELTYRLAFLCSAVQQYASGDETDINIRGEEEASPEEVLAGLSGERGRGHRAASVRLFAGCAFPRLAARLLSRSRSWALRRTHRETRSPTNPHSALMQSISAAPWPRCGRIVTSLTTWPSRWCPTSTATWTSRRACC